MGIDELLEAIGGKARDREAEIRREAEAEAQRILERARAEAEALRARRLREAEEELRAALARERASVERRERERVMEARAELLERVRRRTADLLDEADADDVYRERLPARMHEALTCLPAGDDVVIRCSPALEEAVRGALSGLDDDVTAGIGLEVEADPDAGAGFRAAAAPGDVVVDATLDRLLARDWEDLARGALDRLEERWAETGAP